MCFYQFRFKVQFSIKLVGLRAYIFKTHEQVEYSKKVQLKVCLNRPDIKLVALTKCFQNKIY
jgi:hypothetical protein